MAFDQPLEADRVDDDNFLVSLVRGPILGTLSWIMGGDEDNDREEELRRGLEDMMILDENEEHCNNDDPMMDAAMITTSNSTGSSGKPKPTLPRMVHSDVSVAGAAGDLQQHQQQHSPEQPPTLAAGMPRCDGALSIEGLWMKNNSHNDNNNNNNHYQLPRTEKKKMSWSENLVEYMDDESVRHEPTGPNNGSPASMGKPIKSAMTRSASIRAHPLAADGDNSSTGSSSKDRKIRYLPNGLDRAHNGLIMPTRPVGGNDPHGNGIESPQWGWYALNTTPPTPEMYHSRSSLKQHEKHSETMSAASSDGNTFDHHAVAAAATRGPNRVFQGLKAGSNRPPVGWPSVPL